MDNENYRAITTMASSESDRKKVVRMADFLTHHREYTTVPDPYYGDYSDFELYDHASRICLARSCWTALSGKR